jgi:hypothetical protein
MVSSRPQEGPAPSQSRRGETSQSSGFETGSSTPDDGWPAGS